MFIKVNGIELFFDVYSSKLKISNSSVEEKPTLIFLHGGPGLGDHTLYPSFWSKFSDIAQVIFIDHRANGRSEQGDKNTWNLKQWGQDLNEFCKTLGIEKPIIAGVSFGGYVALSYATQFPEMVGKIILCNTEAKYDTELRVEAFTKKGGNRAGRIIRRFDSDDDSTELMNEYMKICLPLYSNNPYKPEEMQRCIKKLDTWNFFKREELFKFDFLKKVKLIKAPTLILCGENDPEHPWLAAKKIADMMDDKNVSFNLIRGAGDPVYRDKTNEVFCIINTFIEK